MEIWKLSSTKRCPLIRELRRRLDIWEAEGTGTLQSFLGINLCGWVHYLREGIHGQSDDQLRRILKHILENEARPD